MENLGAPPSSVTQEDMPKRYAETPSDETELAGRIGFLQSSLTSLFHDLRDGDEFRGIDAEYSPVFQVMRWKYNGLSYRLRHDEKEITSFEQRRPFPRPRSASYQSTILVFTTKGGIRKFRQDYNKRGMPMSSLESYDFSEDDYSEFTDVIAEMRASNRRTFTGKEVHPSVAAQSPSWIKRVMHRLITPVGE